MGKGRGWVKGQRVRWKWRGRARGEAVGGGGLERVDLLCLGTRSVRGSSSLMARAIFFRVAADMYDSRSGHAAPCYALASRNNAVMFEKGEMAPWKLMQHLPFTINSN